jgi:hypothetical protein
VIPFPAHSRQARCEGRCGLYEGGTDESPHREARLKPAQVDARGVRIPRTEARREGFGVERDKHGDGER